MQPLPLYFLAVKADSPSKKRITIKGIKVCILPSGLLTFFSISTPHSFSNAGYITACGATSYPCPPASLIYKLA